MPLAPTNLDPIDPITNPQGHLNILHQRGNTLFRNASLLHNKVNCKYLLCLEFPTVNGTEIVIGSSARPEDFLSFFTGEITEAAFRCAHDITPHKEIMKRLDRIEQAAQNGVVHPNLLQKHIPSTDTKGALAAAMRNLAAVSSVCLPSVRPPAAVDVNRTFREDTERERAAEAARHLSERYDHSMTAAAWIEHHALTGAHDSEEAEPNTLTYLYPDRRLHKALYPKAKGVEPLLYSKLSLGADGSAFKILQKAKRTGGKISDILREKHQAKRTIRKAKANRERTIRVRNRILEKQRNRVRMRGCGSESE